jgi:hypothetical protein
MRLGFDQFGDIELDSDGYLETFTEYASEVQRFNMFFGSKKYSYIFDRQFGLMANDVFGKFYIEELDLAKFDNDLVTALFASNLFPEAEISTIQEDPRTLKTTVTLGDASLVWDFHLHNGRLVGLSVNDESVSTVIPATVVYLRAHGRPTYDISHIFERCISSNNILEEDNATYSYLLQDTTLNKATPIGTLITDYEIDEFNKLLILSSVIGEKRWIRFTMWPSGAVELVAETNPYILRK